MKFNKVTVAGGGVLGSQVAYQCEYKGFDTTIWLRSEGSIERCEPKLDRWEQTYEASLEAMKTPEGTYCPGLADRDATPEQLDELKEQAKKARKDLKLTTDWDEAFGDADLVIECIAEDPQQKIDFYEELQKHIPKKTVIVSNSSMLLPSTFAPHTGRPEKFLALHFANGIWLSNTAEIMGHAGTDKKYYDEIVEFAAQIGMEPLQLKKEQHGYILNTLLPPFMEAGVTLVATGVADAETVDKAWFIASKSPFGPLHLADMIGMQTCYNVTKMYPDADDPTSVHGQVCALYKKMLDEGKTGQLAGEGFFKYDK